MVFRRLTDLFVRAPPPHILPTNSDKILFLKIPFVKRVYIPPTHSDGMSADPFEPIASECAYEFNFSRTRTICRREFQELQVHFQNYAANNSTTCPVTAVNANRWYIVLVRIKKKKNVLRRLLFFPPPFFFFFRISVPEGGTVLIRRRHRRAAAGDGETGICWPARRTKLS